MTDLNSSNSRLRSVTQDEIALMARELVLVTLPHKDPGDVPEWTRQNGKITLAMQPGYKRDPRDHSRRVCIGYPYGSTARLILYWMVTEARRTGEAKLWLGKSLLDFMQKLGIPVDDSTGKRSSATSIHRQLERLIYARIILTKELEEGTQKGHLDVELPVAKARCLWWDAKDMEQQIPLDSYVILNDDFFKAILTQPVPVRTLTLLALKKSPLGLDLYAWATLESYKAQHHQQGRFVAWKLLHEQFGSELGRLKDFVRSAKRELRKIMCNCPTIKLALVRGGVQMLAESLPDVPIRAAQDVLQSPPSRLTISIPSSQALEHVRNTPNISESAVMIGVAFLKAVKRGEVEKTDEAYISFANQYVINK